MVGERARLNYDQSATEVLVAYDVITSTLLKAGKLHPDISFNEAREFYVDAPAYSASVSAERSRLSTYLSPPMNARLQLQSTTIIQDSTLRQFVESLRDMVDNQPSDIVGAMLVDVSSLQSESGIELVWCSGEYK
jgi:hypothetical protein